MADMNDVNVRALPLDKLCKAQGDGLLGKKPTPPHQD